MKRLMQLALVIAMTAPLSAQEIESIAGVRFTFDTPGTRSLSMGGTGAASPRADAAVANPASIAGATRSYSVDVRRRSMEGRYYVDSAMNTVGQSSGTQSLGSAFFVVPSGRFAFALGYDEPFDVDHSTAALLPRNGPITNASWTLCHGRLGPESCGGAVISLPAPATVPVNVSMSLRRYSTSGSWTAGALAVGASARYERMAQHTTDPGYGYPITEDTRDGSWTYAVGALWRPAPFARCGASFSSGGRFDGLRSVLGSGGTQAVEFRTPSSLRVGGEMDVLPRLTVAAEAVRVRYSEMIPPQRAPLNGGSEFGMPDVTELHAGAEYRVGAFAFRAGWWRDPAHAPSLTNRILTGLPLAYVVAIVSESERHVTGGISAGGRTRFEAGIDRGTRSQRVSFGVVSTF